MDTGIGRTRDEERARGERARGERGERAREVVGKLFPAAEAEAEAEAPPPGTGRRVLGAVVQIVAVAAGAGVLLERVPGVPVWDTVYGEDYWEFLVQAIQRPWHLFIAYSSYEQLLPRVIAQFALCLPLGQASRVFAVSGAVVAAATGLFVYHATAGHVRSAALRALLGAAVVLLPSAPMEIADSGVNTLWYLLIAAFWALLWRPRTRGAMFAAALVAFVAAASNIMVVLLAPLAAMRSFALRRPREHAAPAGWLAGCLVQLPELASGHGERLGGKLATAHQALAFYAHDVVLPSLGWHLAWRLRGLAGENGATAIVAIVLIAVFGAIAVTQAPNRPFVVTALATGFALPVFGVTVTARLAARPALPDLQPGARYTALPIFLIECAAVLGTDYLLRQHLPRRRTRARPAIAVAILVAALGASWVTDFRYPGFRSDAGWNWAPIAARWQRSCERSDTGVARVWIPVSFEALPCDTMRF